MERNELTGYFTSRLPVSSSTTTVYHEILDFHGIRLLYRSKNIVVVVKFVVKGEEEGGGRKVSFYSRGSSICVGESRVASYIDSRNRTLKLIRFAN